MGTGCRGGGEETSTSCDEGGAPSSQSQSQGVLAAVVRVEKGQEAKMVLSMTVAASTQALLSSVNFPGQYVVVEKLKESKHFLQGNSF